MRILSFLAFVAVVLVGAAAEAAQVDDATAVVMASSLLKNFIAGETNDGKE